MSPISQFKSFLTTVADRNGTNRSVRVRAIEVSDPSVINVEHVANKSVANSGKYGVNGTFFYPVTCTDSSVYLAGIAINSGSVVRYDGDRNNLGVDSRGTMYRLTNGTISTKPVKTSSEIASSRSNIRWAIGGVSLFLEKSYTNSTAYINDAVAEGYPVGEVNLLTQRTAIGYGNNKIYLVTAWNPNNDATGGIDLWGLRTIMKNSFNCSRAVNLDGGGSTGIAYMTSPNSTRQSNSSSRCIYSMVTVPQWTFTDIEPF